MSDILIRKSRMEDLDKIMKIFDIARQMMRDCGNNIQWINGYPSRELVIDDINSGNGYVVEIDGEIVSAFAFIIGVDETYLYIENGAWLNDEPYGTIHRIGTNGKVHGIMDIVTKYCENFVSNIRVDTHEVNLRMQHVLEKLGYVKCGIIYISDGTPRVAYQKIVNKL